MTARPRLGVDVGGTFTDLVLADGDEIRVAKVPSTPADQAEGVLAGIERLGVDPAELARFAHGTTVATNTLLERNGARTVLVTTAGFRDLLEIGRQDRPSLYDLELDRTPPLVTRGEVIEVNERLSSDGTVLTPLTDDEIDRAVAAVAALEPEAVAVSLLFCFLDDTHERRVTDALAVALGSAVPISRSSDVLAVFREYERSSTTAVNAYVAPRMARYLGSLESRLRDTGLPCALEVMRSGGGTFTADVAQRYPVLTLLSGPAAGAWGAAAVGRAAGEPDVIAFDMGGTSTDVTLIVDGRPRTTAEGEIDGLPFAVTTTDIHTVGSGGGSIAWRDAGGSLRVGPRSAGADPGPASYGRGGELPTVTDANVVLGRLGEATALGGHLELRPELADGAVDRLAAELSMDRVGCADGILRVVEAQMAKALRVVSVEKGHDPRGFTLMPFGGAGPLHQAALARDLGCQRVLVPPSAGVLSALGLLAAPPATEEVRTILVRAEDAAAAELAKTWDELEAAARGLLADQGIEVAVVQRSADLRYRGQAFELEVLATTAEPDPADLATAFHAVHAERYGYDQPEEPVEIVNLRVRVEGPAPDVPLPEIEAGRGAGSARRGATSVVVDGDPRDCPVYDRAALGRGDTLDGPAVVAGVDTTVFVAAWQHLEVDRIGALVLTDREAGS